MIYMTFANLRVKKCTKDLLVADVDVTTVERGFWWFQKTETTCTREVARGADYWFFTDTGRYCPTNSVEKLEYDLNNLG